MSNQSRITASPLSLPSLPSQTIAKISLYPTAPRNHSQRLSLIDSDTPTSPSRLTPFPIAITYFHHHPPIVPNYYYSHFHRTRSPSWSHPRPKPTPDLDSPSPTTPISTLDSTKTLHIWIRCIGSKSSYSSIGYIHIRSSVRIEGFIYNYFNKCSCLNQKRSLKTNKNPWIPLVLTMKTSTNKDLDPTWVTVTTVKQSARVAYASTMVVQMRITERGVWDGISVGWTSDATAAANSLSKCVLFTDSAEWICLRRGDWNEYLPFEYSTDNFSHQWCTREWGDSFFCLLPLFTFRT